MDLPPLATAHAHSTTCLLVHLVWGTRSRVPWLLPRFDRWLAELLERTARGIDCQLLAVGNADDHVHTLVRYPSRLSVAELARRLKGASSRTFHLALPEAQGHDWQTGYWAESISHRDLETLIPYVRTQRTHHQSTRAEPWER